MKLFREINIILLFIIAICSCKNQNIIEDRRKDAIQLNNESVQMLDSLETSELQNNLYFEALQKINQAISLDSTYRQAYFTKAWIYVKQKKYYEALNWIDTVIFVLDNEPTIRQLQGFLNEKIGNKSKADSIYFDLIKYYDIQFRKNPKDFKSFTAKMYMLTFLNQKENAIRQLDSLIELYPKENLLPMTKEMIENADFDEFFENL